MQLKEYLKGRRLITDGAMGTYFAKKHPDEKQMPEACNLSCPQQVEQIHLEYIKSGAKLIRTNTFAANTMFFEDMETVARLIAAGWEIARSAVEKSGENVWIAADIGPIYDPQFLGREAVLEEYFAICDIFLKCGAQVFVLETQADFTYVEAVTEYLKQRRDVFTMVQFAVDQNGYTRSGLSLGRIIQKASSLETIDAYGFNCGIGATHLKQLLEKAVFPNEKYITALPNAGYPMELRGRTYYGENRPYFVEMMTEIAGLGVDILGGCCGTTPEYIKDIRNALDGRAQTSKRIGVFMQKAKGSVVHPIQERILRGEKLFIAELDPPFDTDISKVMQGAVKLKEAGVDLITLADSPMARTRMDPGRLAAKVQEEAGILAMPHICCRDKNVIALRAGLLGDYMNGIRYFLVVTGDPVGREDRGAITPVFDVNSIRLMEYFSEMNQELFSEDPVFYGGALNYHGANPDAMIRRVRQKMENGCGMFLTQPVYGKEDIERIAGIKRQTGAKIMCGILPLVSYRNAKFLANEMPGIRVPQEVMDRYDPAMSREEAEQIGIDLAVELAVAMEELADGYYFMTPFNRAGMIAEIIQRVKTQQEV